MYQLLLNNEYTFRKTLNKYFLVSTKGFGMIGNRLGLVYTKKPHPTLDLLKQFENWNYGGVKTIELVMKNFAVDEMWNKHKEKQIEIC